MNNNRAMNSTTTATYEGNSSVLYSDTDKTFEKDNFSDKDDKHDPKKTWKDPKTKFK
jgi:hypothetical protein